MHIDVRCLPGSMIAPEHCSGAPCRQYMLTAHVTLQAVVRVMLERVWERGDIYKANYEGVPHNLIDGVADVGVLR